MPELRTRPFDPGAVEHLVVTGWAGRDRASVEAHIHELEALGLPRPTRTPIFYRAATSLLTTRDAIEVVGDRTSGEVEFVLVRSGGAVWVGVGSDHTDRALEISSVALSKQVCAKVVSPELWAFDDVGAHWDRLVLRSWARRDGERRLYQDGSVSAILAPERLLSLAEEAEAPTGEGTVLFSGTIPAIGGVAPADVFEMEMHDPLLDRSLRHAYEVRVLPVVC
jgi:hypothetical protein